MIAEMTGVSVDKLLDMKYSKALELYDIAVEYAKFKGWKFE